MPIWGTSPDSNSVGSAQLQVDAVTNPKVANEAINTAELADAAVTTPKIATDAVTTPKIVDGAVTGAKLASGAVFYQTVKNPAGAAATQRAVLKFTGAGIASVSDVAAETVVDVSGGGGGFYQTVQDNGSDQTQRDKLNFVGAVITDSASPSRTNVNVTPADGSITTVKLASAAVRRPFVIALGGTSNITLTTSFQDIITAAAITPQSTDSVFRFTYAALHTQFGGTDENYLTRLTKNVAGGGVVAIKQWMAGGTPSTASRYKQMRTIVWMETGLAASSTVFQISERTDPTATQVSLNVGTQFQPYLIIEEILR